MFSDTLTTLLILLLIILGLVSAWGILSIGTKRYPALHVVLAALQPHVMMGIWAATELAYEALTDLGKEMQGIDRKAIADSIYGALPDIIMIGNLPIPTGLVKTIVSREVFENYVQDNFDRAMALLSKNKEYFKSQVDLWEKENTEGS